MSESPERAPMGGPAESEVPLHTADLDAAGAVDAHRADDTEPLEDSLAYELAVEDGAPLPGSGADPGAGEAAPLFREPGEA